MKMKEIPIPKRIHRGQHEIVITWDENHVGRYPARELRLRCHCAECVDEMTGLPLLDPDAIAADISALSISLVGSYAIKIDWSDGHNTGIYAFDSLMAMCPCAECVARRTS
jgi:ATP-binding protein involved in chromosome partitioning